MRPGSLPGPRPRRASRHVARAARVRRRRGRSGRTALRAPLRPSGRRGRRSPRRKGARTSWPSVDIRASVRTGSLPAANQARHAGRRSAEIGEVKRLLVAFTAVAALVLPARASAHPLGNFTVNRFSRIEVAGPRVYVHYVLDLAEIPTFQAGRIDAHAYAARLV